MNVRTDKPGFSFPETLALKIFSDSSEYEILKKTISGIFDKNNLKYGKWSSKRSRKGNYLSVTVKTTFPDMKTMKKVYSEIYSLENIISVI
ncbi:MAG: DUF493 family protein [bacterium]